MNCSDRQLADEAGNAFRFDDRVGLGELDSTRSQIQHGEIIGRRHDLALLTFTAWLRVLRHLVPGLKVLPTRPSLRLVVGDGRDHGDARLLRFLLLVDQDRALFLP